LGDGVIQVAQPVVGREEVEAVSEVLLSGNYVSGRRVELFEEAFAAYVGCAHAVAVSSGTAALHIALEALGVGEGDEVIVPPLTFFATVSSVLYLRAVPVFADIDPDDLCMSPEDARRKITSRTKAVVPVHIFGGAAKMDGFLELSRETGIPVVEDCAQAHGTRIDGKRVGALGDTGCFSFFATKHMTTGEGGMITTQAPQVAEKARMLRNHGMKGRDRHVVLGFNHRMTEMEAAMGLVQLRRLEELNGRRIANSEFILERVGRLPWAWVPPKNDRVQHTYFWCPVMVREESGRSFQDLKEFLRRHAIQFRERYQEPLYRQEVLGAVGLDYSGVFLPQVEAVAGKILGLPNHPLLTREELNRIVSVLESF
jgi:dTDP-4-amino-4,6-dideoxygalactose transaminase